MTQDNNTDATDAQDVNESVEDSPVIKELRKQLRDMQKELKSVPTRSDLEAELRAQLAREMAVETQLEGFGVPKGIRSVVEEKLGDAEVSAEAVAEALKAIGFEVDEDGGASDSAADPDTEVVSDLAEVTSTSAKVRSAAKGGAGETIEDKLGKAQSRDEIAAIAAEGGFLQNNY